MQAIGFFATHEFVGEGLPRWMCLPDQLSIRACEKSPRWIVAAANSAQVPLRRVRDSSCLGMTFNQRAE
jgi:hypothetical protein